jgi:hypothetical protein
MTYFIEVVSNVRRIHVFVSASQAEDSEASEDERAVDDVPPRWPAVPTAWSTAAPYSVVGGALRVAVGDDRVAKIALPVAVDASTVRAELCGDHVHVACNLDVSPYLTPMHQWASERRPTAAEELAPRWWRRSALSCRCCAAPLLRLGSIARATKRAAHAWTGEIMESAFCEECVQDAPDLARPAVDALREWSERPLHASQPKIAVVDSVSVQVVRSALRSGAVVALPGAARGADDAWLACAACRAVVGRLETLESDDVGGGAGSGGPPPSFARLFKFALALAPRAASGAAAGGGGERALFADYAVDSHVGSHLLRAVQDAGVFALDVRCPGAAEPDARSSAVGAPPAPPAESDCSAAPRVLRLRMLGWNARIATERAPLQPAIKVGYRVFCDVGGGEAAPLAAELDLLLGDAHFSALVERLRASSEWCPPSRRDAGDGDAVGYLMW